MKAKFFAAALAGMVTIALFGGLLYGVIFARLFASNQVSATGVMKTPPDLLWVAIAHVPFGVLLTLVVLWRGKTTARGGAFTGAILGLLMAASYDFSQYGTTNLWTLKLTLVEPLITMVIIGAAGSVVGTVLGWRTSHTIVE
ncbi:hypothetical protein L0244_28960 [bacterium]|nr:hypothetical protein [bacterium]